MRYASPGSSPGAPPSGTPAALAGLVLGATLGALASGGAARMWCVALPIFFGFKFATLASALDAGRRPRSERARPSRLRIAGYLLAWPGMDAARFLGLSGDDRQPAPGIRESLAALAKTLLGAGLVAFAARLAQGYGAEPPTPPIGFPLLHEPLAIAWIGLVGLGLFFHFGTFHLLSVAWRRAAVDAPPIMRSPLLADSLADFWGRRWNLAFRRLALDFVVRPLAPRFGAELAGAAAYLVSGAIHDLAISLPARGGFGGPTLYFAIQWAGSRLERRLARRPLARRILAIAFAALPAPLLFHAPFLERVVLPLLRTTATLAHAIL